MAAEHAIFDGREARLWWEPGEPGTRRRVGPVRGVVWHWTGGRNHHGGIHSTLRNRRDPKTRRPTPLSIHYTISRGEIMQQADPSTTVCSHAGVVNDWTIGVEIAHKGMQPAFASQPRARYTSSPIHGRTWRLLRHHVDDLKAVLWLADYLSDEYEIPRRVPVDLDGSLVLDVLPETLLATYAGHLGHLHVSERKRDPGEDLLLALRDAWAKR